MTQAKTVNASDVAQLWLRMTQVFGHRFTRLYGNKDDGSWLMVLKRLSPDALQYGFQRMVSQHQTSAKTGETIWPPNALEFRGYCHYRLSDAGIPNVHCAFEEASTNSRLAHPHWTHQAVRFAWWWLEKPVGEPLYLSDYPTFERVYRNLCNYYRQIALRQSINNSLARSDQHV